ncbi:MULTISPECIES: putative quinol monooxygenase [Edwardsiella]|uniref:Antibiotic biosynthesis monooxygenase n=4 Tax=Edwardsiella anguillarum TaxID=1821960 RepID=A0A076LLP9_9GAMM|nr:MULTISPECIES: putative quinol monooxygenase [Edwardsiella]AKM47576.1 antibiotic biosynthesis monooxygenase [Edwardsiella sp. EA181011]GAJ66285.1 antibiotic biosynthesis monooxygenase [Edwardsiella piscicida]AIJ06589.1 Antibiotic biosynthesis monooxygenase [Edwardsiella anguillarum ET080813]AKR78122.1 antibiotic biosynthesis monooxygenase [Edwardsiella sp. LADL05-105]KAB0593232.1 antibiotic biosynthesis monooxygenase [Edwardsiella anguillarum]
MSEVRIVATLVASAGQQEAVRHAALQLVEPSRAEAGNVRYDLHQEEGQAATLVFFEIWQSPQALAQHEKSAHFAAFLQAIEGRCASVEIKRLRQIA